MKRLSTSVLAMLALIPAGVLHAESFQKNYVNQCSDPGFGGCPTARVPYQTPKNTQLIPNPVPVLVPKMLPVLEPRKYFAVPKLQQAPEPMEVKVPNAIPNRVPNLEPKVMEVKVPNAIPNRVPNLEPKVMEVKVPNAIPNRVPMQVPYLVPNRIPDMIPQPKPQLVPEQVLPTQKIPGFAKTIGRPGEVNVEIKPKETPMIEKREYEYNKTRVVELIPTKYGKQIEKFEKLQHIRRLEKKIVDQHLQVVDAVRGANKVKQDPTSFVLGGIAITQATATFAICKLARTKNEMVDGVMKKVFGV